MKVGSIYNTKKMRRVKIMCISWDGDHPIAGYSLDFEHMNIDDLLLWDIDGISIKYQYDGWDIVYAEGNE